MCVWLRAMVSNVTACASTITVARTRASDRTVRSRGYPTYPGGHLLVLPLGGELARHRIIGADCGGDQASLFPLPISSFFSALPAVSWVKHLAGDRTMQFSDRQRHISDS